MVGDGLWHFTRSTVTNQRSFFGMILNRIYRVQILILGNASGSLICHYQRRGTRPAGASTPACQDACLDGRFLRLPLAEAAAHKNAGDAADGISGVKTKGGQDKAFFFAYLWVLDSPVSKPSLCFCICFSDGFLCLVGGIFIGSARSKPYSLLPRHLLCCGT